MIVDIEITLDIDYVYDSNSDVKEPAIDVQTLLRKTYGNAQTFDKIQKRNTNVKVNESSDIITNGYEVTGTSKIKC